MNTTRCPLLAASLAALIATAGLALAPLPQDSAKPKGDAPKQNGDAEKKPQKGQKDQSRDDREAAKAKAKW